MSLGVICTETKQILGSPVIFVFGNSLERMHEVKKKRKKYHCYPSDI